jgi:hypothetical protein
MIHITSITRRFRLMDAPKCRETTARLRAELAIERHPSKRVIHVEASERFRTQGEQHE